MSYYRDKPGSYRGMGGRGGGNNFNHQAQNANFGGRQPQRNPGGYGYDSPRNPNFDDRRNYPGPAFDQPPYRPNHNNSNHYDDYDPRDRDNRVMDGGHGGQWDRDHRRPGPLHPNDSMRGNANPASLLPNRPPGNSNNILALSLISSLLQQQQGLPQLLDRPHGPQPPQNNRSAGNMPYNSGPGERRPMNRGFPEDQGPNPKMPRMDEGFKTPSGRGRNSERGRGRGRERSRSATGASPSTSLPRRLATPPASQPRATPNSAPPAANRRGQGSRGGKKKGRGRKITYTPAPPASNTTSATSTVATAPQTEGQAGSESQAVPTAEAAATPAQVQDNTTTGTDKTPQTSGDTPAPAAEEKATEGDKTLDSKADETREENKETELTEENKVEVKDEVEADQKSCDGELKSPAAAASATNTRKKGDKDNTPFGGLPKELLYCHVCMKHMRDGTSFMNHLGGRAHQLLMKKLEESYELRGNLIRHYVAMEEQRRNVELDRLYRLGKAHNIQQDFCAMCNLKFFGNVSIHRKTPLHQALKRFLHPPCNVCKKEFSNRVDRDFHKLTAEHLKAVAALEGKIAKDTEDEVEDFGSLLEVLSSCKEEEGLPSDLLESPIFSDYNPDEPIGQTMVKRVDAFYCRLCRIILPNEAESGAHCRTKAHYDNYSVAVKEAVEVKKNVPTVEPSQVEQKDESTAVAEEPTPASAAETETATETASEVKEVEENGSEAPPATEEKMEVDKSEEKPEEKPEEQKVEEKVSEAPATEAN